MKKNTQKPSPKSSPPNLTERVMLSVTADERIELEKHAAKMSADLGVPVSLSAACRALALSNLRAQKES